MVKTCRRFFGDTKLETLERVTLETEEDNGEVSSSMTLSNCVLDDATSVRVTAVNSVAEESCIVKLKVKGW